MGSPAKHIQYRYDSRGNRQSLIDPDGGRFTYSYDARNRIQSVQNPQGERTTYSYDVRNRRTVMELANGTRTSFVYDAVSNLRRLSNLKSDGSVISDFQYRYDKTGNRTSVVEADGSRVTWSYDAASQLTGEFRTGPIAYRNTFAYDPAGNRTLKNEGGVRTTYSYDVANQLKWSQDASGRTTYTFDADGNQERVLAPDGSRTTTVWDYENRATSVRLPSGIRNTMSYEPGGLRVKLEESTGTKKFVWDDQNYLAETDGSNDTQVVYTNEPRHYGNLVSQRRGSTTSWYHFDALGSTRQLTDAAQAITDERLYDAWGTVIKSSGSTVLPFQYVGNAGYYTDADQGTIYIRARIYEPAIARWWAIDPLGRAIFRSIDTFLAGQLAEVLYRYANCAPTLVRDPSGLRDEHHWFPQLNGRGQGMVDALCCKEGIQLNIDDYTTKLGKYKVGTPHHQVHVDYKYVPVYELILDNSKNCCDLIMHTMLHMDTAWQGLRKQDGKLPLHPPLVEFGTGTGDNWPKLLGLLADACGPSSVGCEGHLQICMRYAEDRYRRCDNEWKSFFDRLRCKLFYLTMPDTCRDEYKSCAIRTNPEIVGAGLAIVVLGGLVILAPEITLPSLPALPNLPGLPVPAF